MDTINAIKALHQQPMRPPKLLGTPIDILTTFDTFTELLRKKLLHHRDQYFQFRDNRQFAGYRGVRDIVFDGDSFEYRVNLRSEGARTKASAGFFVRFRAVCFCGGNGFEMCLEDAEDIAPCCYQRVEGSMYF